MFEKILASGRCHNRVSRAVSVRRDRMLSKGDRKANKAQAGHRSNSMATLRVQPAKVRAVVANVAAGAAVSSNLSNHSSLNNSHVMRMPSGRRGRMGTGKAGRISSATHRADIAAGIGTERSSRQRVSSETRRPVEFLSEDRLALI